MTPRPVHGPVTERTVRTARSWLAHPIGALVAGAVAAAMVVPAAAAVGTWIDGRSDAAVERLVDAYVAALLTGDAEGATAMAPPDASLASPALLTDDVLDTTVRPPIECAQPIIDGAEAHATCVVDAIPQPGWSISLALDADGWSITEGLAARVRFGDGPVTGVGGVELPATTGVAVREVWLYPGTYLLDVLESPLLDADSTQLAVAGDTDVVGLGDVVGLSDAAVGLEQDAAVAFVAECAADGGCAAGEQPTSSTSFIAIGGEPTVVDPLVVETVYAVQRLEAGVPTSTHAVLVTSTFDATFSALEPAASVAVDEPAWLP